MNPLDLAQPFQVRLHESRGLKALFEKVFFDVPYSDEAVDALGRTEFFPAADGSDVDRSSGNFGHLPRSVLLYRGESGIGKTRIFRQFRSYAEERRIPVYEIHCYDVEGIPFKPFLRVIREILHDFEYGDVLREKYRPGLESLLPEVFKNQDEEGGAPDDEVDSGATDLERSEDWDRDKVRIFDGITQLLFEITAVHPVVILVHDLNWGDQGTIELLRYIGRNMQLRAQEDPPSGAPVDSAGSSPVDDPEEVGGAAGVGESRSTDMGLSADSRDGAWEPGATEESESRRVRLMVVANYKGSDREDDYLERSLRSLGRETFAYHAQIGTLSVDETARFVRASLKGRPDRIEIDDDAAECIYRHAEGFPSYIQACLRLLLGEPSASAGVQTDRITRERVDQALTGSAGGMAPSVSFPRYRILEQRLSESTENELSVLRVLALARKPLTMEFLSGVTDFEDDDLGSCLRSLEDRYLVEKVGQLYPHGGERDGYFFRIWDYVDVVDRLIPDGEERQTVHRKIGTLVLEQRRRSGGEKAYEVFYHLARGGQFRSAVQNGLIAARRLAGSFSIEKAILVLDELLGVLDVSKDQETRLEVLQEKTSYHVWLRDYQKAEECIQQILSEGGQELDVQLRVDLLVREAAIYRMAGETHRALKSLSKCYKLIPDANSIPAVRWNLASARVRRERGDLKRCQNLCLKGIKICNKLFEQRGGRENGPQERGGGISGLRLLAELHGLLAETFLRRGDEAHAVDNYQLSLEAFERLGDQTAMARVLDDLGEVCLEQGNHFRAARHYFKALEIQRRSLDIAGLCRSYDQLAQVHLRTRDEVKALGHLNYSLRLKERTGDVEGLNSTLIVLGDLHYRLGRYAQAIIYFRREIQNSETLSHTRALVDGFIHLGRVYFAMGDREQVEKLAKQVAILAIEFKLKAQEAGGARLTGLLETQKRNWSVAETELKSAFEIYSKAGNRRQETQVLLEQAEVKFARQSFDEAFKLVSKAYVLAEQVKDVDLQLRAHVVKANVYRFHKGGNVEKVKELLRQGLELAREVSDVHLLFDLYYSLAKVYHYDREFVEAGNHYGKAETILRRIADELDDAQAVSYLDDPRRKLFLEDANRFRKEVRTRPKESPEFGESTAALEDAPIGVADYEDLQKRVLSLHAAQHHPDLFEALVSEACDLVKGERAFILRVKNRQYSLVVEQGFGELAEDNPEFPSAQAITEDAIRKGKTVCLTGSEERREGRNALAGALLQRTVLIVPLMTPERIFGALYVDRSASMGQFGSRDRALLELLASHVGNTMENRRHFETIIREPLTGLFTNAYFLERLRQAYRENNLHGRPFVLVGFHIPTLESSLKEEPGVLGERLLGELYEELPNLAVASWGSSILTVLVFDTDFRAVDRLAQRIQGRLISVVNYRVLYEVLLPDARIPNSKSLFDELRRRLLPDESDQHTIMEIRQLLSREITLKDAKRVLEKHIIENTLRKTGGNITHAAKELGIHRPQLSNLLKKYELKRERFERGGLSVDREVN